jgi:hypothetical protein
MDATSMPLVTPVAASRNGNQNKLMPHDRAAHEWYRFVLSFPPHLVRRYLERFDIGPGKTLLDPFCGTGTTLVECKKCGISSLGIEAHPMARFASPLETWPSGGSAGALVTRSGLRPGGFSRRQRPDIMLNATEVHIL